MREPRERGRRASAPDRDGVQDAAAAAAVVEFAKGATEIRTAADGCPFAPATRSGSAEISASSPGPRWSAKECVRAPLLPAAANDDDEDDDDNDDAVNIAVE